MNSLCPKGWKPSSLFCDGQGGAVNSPAKIRLGGRFGRTFATLRGNAYIWKHYISKGGFPLKSSQRRSCKHFSQEFSETWVCLMEPSVSGTSPAFHLREFLFPPPFCARNYPKLMFIIPPRVFVGLPGEKWLDINLTARLLGNMLCQIVYIISAFPSLNPDPCDDCDEEKEWGVRPIF